MIVRVIGIMRGLLKIFPLHVMSNKTFRKKELILDNNDQF